MILAVSRMWHGAMQPLRMLPIYGVIMIAKLDELHHVHRPSMIV